MSARSALHPALAAALAVLLSAPAGAAAGSAASGEGARRPLPIFRTGRAPTPAGARLLYFGGRVLSNVEVVLVLWGDGPFAPYVTGEEHPSIPDLLGAVAGSGYLTGLAEYDTTRLAVGGAPGTQQHIGPGRFGGVARIAPMANSEAVDDRAIAAELAAQLGRGALPPPRAGPAGNPETLYLVYFPAGKRITMGGTESCRAFCAYHGTFPWNGRPVSYAVLPDLSPGSGCDLGCGEGTPFASAAGIVTHELVEAVTDPDVALATADGPPLAWYDPVHGEAGDLCADQAGTVTGTDGGLWPVQRVWSNVHDGCVVPGPAASVLVASAAAAPDAEATAATPPGSAGASPGAIAALGAAGPGAPRRTAALALRPALAAPGASPGPVPPPGALPRALPSEPTPLPLARGTRVALEEENDALAARRHPTDELYTQGFRVSARWAIAGDGTAAREVGFALGQNLYTPGDLRTRDLDVLRHDRPYAGWTYGAFLLRAVEPAAHTLRLGADAAGPGEWTSDVELAAGVTGPPSGGAEVQTGFHALLRRWSGNPTSPAAPAGWSTYQTSTRPTLDATVRQQVDLVQASTRLRGFTGRTGSVLGVRVSPRGRLDIGTTFDAAGAGVETRAGLLAPGRHRAGAADHFELYAFARADGRYVLHNGFIDGPLRGGVRPLVSVRPWVGDLDLGAVLRLGSLEVGYGQIWRTSELRPNPPGERPVHVVGQVTVAWVGG